MSGYRRFIAYVYEYQKGKKGGSCGFIKVEIRNQRCRVELHLHCPGLPPQTECRTYGIVRKDGLMNGILLGICQAVSDTVECLFETDSINMAGSGIPFDKTGGIVVLTHTGGFFGTEWDDQPVRPEHFREMPLPQPSEALPGVSRSDAEIPAASPALSAESADISEAPEQEAAAEISPLPEASQLIYEAGNILSEPDSRFSPNTESAPPETDIRFSSNTESASHEADLTFSGEAEPAALKDAPVPADASLSLTSEAAASTAQSDIVSVPVTDEEPPASPDRSEPLLPEFAPFDDMEFIHCWKIHPADLSRISPRTRSLRNNRFLQYGYYSFGHLLLARRSGGRFVLGVPGGYDQQERFMAGMFGFPYFKECRHIELPGNRGGYWYRLIDAPNFH